MVTCVGFNWLWIIIYTLKPSQLATAELGVYPDKQPFQREQNIEYTGKRQPSYGNDYALQVNRNTLSMLPEVAMLLALSMIVVLPIDIKVIAK